jgi:hypothetical protein
MAPPLPTTQHSTAERERERVSCCVAEEKRREEETDMFIEFS